MPTQTTTKISVHQEGESPIFSEAAITVELDDEAAGMFLVLDAPGSDAEKLRLDFEDVPEIVKAIKTLSEQPGVIERRPNPMDQIQIVEKQWKNENSEVIR